MCIRDRYREEYADFTVKHFHEELRREHHYTLGYTCLLYTSRCV